MSNEELKHLESELLVAFQTYREEMADKSTINKTTYRGMSSGIFGCELIVKHLIKHKTNNANTK